MTSLIQKSINNSLTRANSDVISVYSMPSNNYEDLTLGASGTSHTAPANGWFYLAKNAGSSGKYVQMYHSSFIGTNQKSTDDSVLRLFLPVKKGDSIKTEYSATGSTIYFRFIYAEGDQ